MALPEKVVPVVDKKAKLQARAVAAGLDKDAAEHDVKLAESKLPNARPNIGIEGTLTDLQKRAVAVDLDYNASEEQILTAESSKGIRHTPSLEYRRSYLGLSPTAPESDVLAAEKERGIHNQAEKK